MKPSTIGKVISAVLLGILFGGSVHLDHVKRGKAGREEYLAKQGERFDKHFAKPAPIALELFVGVIMGGALFATYELVSFGISKALKRTQDNNDGS